MPLAIQYLLFDSQHISVVHVAEAELGSYPVHCTEHCWQHL